jgi:hypothetical protein
MTEEERSGDDQQHAQKCAVPMTGSRLDAAMSAPAQARSIPMLLAELGLARWVRGAWYGHDQRG